MAFVANTDNMGQLVSTLGTAANNIDDRLAQLEAYGDRLKSTWTGPAGDAYDTQKANWHRAATQMNDMLLQFKLHLNNITEGIVTTENTATKRWHTM